MSNSKFYFARAEDCAREAREARLENVREKCLRSQAAWLAMAERMLKNEERTTERRHRDAASPDPKEAALDA